MPGLGGFHLNLNDREGVLRFLGFKIIQHIRKVPAWALSFFAALVSAVIIGNLKNFIEPPFTYIVWSLLLMTASFLISILHPRRVWVIPLYCNILVILPAVFDDSFWNSSLGGILGTGVLLSLVVAKLGAMISKYETTDI